jgi:predicted N-acyltransferase
MAENKKSFVLYTDSQGLVNQLPDEIAGRLFKHIYAYVNDENPISDELLLNIAFEPIKMQLKRDLKKWEETKEGRSVAGKASAEARRLAKINQQDLTNSTNVHFVQQTSTNSTVNDNVNVNVNVNDILIQPKVVIDWDALLVQFNQLTKRNHKLIPDKAKRQLLARLKDGYTKQDIWNAIQNCYNDEYHKETNHKYLTLEFISRPDKMERYSVDVIKTKNIDKSKIGML